MPLTLAKRLAVINAFLEPGKHRFLDCGCGVGEYVRVLTEVSHQDACGIEYDQQAVNRARLDPALQDRIFQGDLQAINYPDNEWDYAMLNEVLEHVADDRKVLQEACRILKPNGVLFVFSPNRWFPFETHGVVLKRSKRMIHWLPFIPYLPVKWCEPFFSGWARNYWPGELRNMVQDAGFLIVGTGFIWPTLENLSGHQPRVFNFIRPLLRFVGNTAEKIPFLKRFGVTQVLVCRKEFNPNPGLGATGNRC